MEIAYCMKCRSKREFISTPVYEEKLTKKGLKAFLLGRCESCDTKMCLATKPVNKGV